MKKTGAQYLNLYSLMEAEREGKLEQYLKDNRQCVENSHRVLTQYRRELKSQPKQRREISIKDVQRIEFHSNF